MANGVFLQLCDCYTLWFNVSLIYRTCRCKKLQVCSASSEAPLAVVYTSMEITQDLEELNGLQSPHMQGMLKLMLRLNPDLPLMLLISWLHLCLAGIHV